MSVDTNTNTYTFVSSHTIRCYNIEFTENDTLVIPEGANVILERTSLTIEEETVGIARITVNGSLTLEEGSAITFGDVSGSDDVSGYGILLQEKGIFTQTGGDITIGSVTNSGDGGAAIGLYVNGGTITQEKGSDITISSVTNSGDGIAVGVFVNGDTFTQEEGSDITIGSVTNSGDGDAAVGLYVNGGTFTQEEGSDITISSVTNSGGDGATTYGVFVGDSKFNVKNLTVSGAEESGNSIGFLSKVVGGVVNSGVVRVYGTAIKYSNDETSETDPSPINNNDGADDSKYFTGKTYF